MNIMGYYYVGRPSDAFMDYGYGHKAVYTDMYVVHCFLDTRGVCGVGLQHWEFRS